MASTPSNRLKLTPSNSPFLQRPSRSPVRARAFHDSSRLSLKRVVGTTCCSPTGFDTVQSCFAYIAGGAVIVVDVHGDEYSQRFYRARPTAIPVFATSPVPHAPSTPNSTPKANDSRNRVAPSHRESFGLPDWAESPSSAKTWTQRERIKTATCLSLSRDGKFLAVGETGYAPRVLIFSLQDSSSDVPLVSISEHSYGVNAISWSPDTRFLASLGTANDGFLYLWKVDPRTGAAKLFQQNRCTSYVKGMIWMGNSLITFGVRHVKIWRVEDGPIGFSPIKQKYVGDGSFPMPLSQKTLPGRNILLGSLLEATFSCAVAIGDGRAIVCTETGDVCLLDDTSKLMKLTRLRDLGFPISCVSVRDGRIHFGSKGGQFAAMDVEELLGCARNPVITATNSSDGLVAMGFLANNIVTIDTRRTIDIWDADYIPGSKLPSPTHIPIPGQGDPIMGIQALPRPNDADAAFCTWSGTGKVFLWSLDGDIKCSFGVPIEQVPPENELDLVNQLSVVRITKGAKLFIAADRLGVLRVIDFATKQCIMETKAHTADCRSISIYEDDSRLIMASCGRDRTAQLFYRAADGTFEHFQTLEFAAKVVQVIIPSDDKIITCSFDRTLQVHDLVSKEDEPEVMAAIPAKLISLKASPSSMVMAPDEKSVFVSLLDRSICQYDLSSGQLLNSFKCIDEGGAESAVLDSLIYGQNAGTETTFLLALSNTDKSVRVYDSQTGAFLDREWGHTEAINGVALIDDEESGRKVVSVGSDGTIMVWALDWNDPAAGAMSRSPSPVKDISLTSSRPPLRRVLSKAELAEFQRPSPSAVGRRSPPRTLSRKTSKYNLSSAGSLRTPLTALQTSPAGTIAENASRRASSGSRSGSPPLVSPKSRVTRRPSLPAMRSTPPTSGRTRKKTSSSNLRGSYGFGSLSMATEQTCRQLRAYRKKLTSADPIAQEVLAELDQELRLTAAALGDRVIRSKAMSQELNGLLDQKLERLVSMLDEKWGLRRHPSRNERKNSRDTTGSATSQEEDGSSLMVVVAERPRTAVSAGPSTSSGSR